MKNKPVLWTALATPMDQAKNIHYADFEKLLRRQDEAGLGLLILGSTGEGFALEENEKREVLTFVKSLKLKSPLMVGVGGMKLKETLNWLDFCESVGVDAYLMVAPLYAKPGALGQRQWFEALMNRVSRPCMLYNVPSRAGVVLSREALKALEHHPRFWAIKEASGSLSEFEKYRMNTPHIEVYSGDDGMLPFFQPLGVAGLVSVVSNLWPTETLRYTERVLSGNVSDLFPLWSDAVNALFRVSNPVPLKVGLHALGHIEYPYLREPLTHEELASSAEILAVHQRVTDWGGNHV